jgi:general secretion pathway protein D
MDFDGVDIRTFIKFISELTGKNFVIDEKVRGKITVLSPSRVTVAEAYRIFESVLEVNGFTAVPTGSVTKIVLSREARSKNLETVLSARSSYAGDAMITQVLPLSHTDALEMRKMLAPMVSKEGLITAYAPSDILIITDFSANIERLVGIVRTIDVEASDAQMTIFPLRHASASQLADKISEILEQTQQGKTRRPDRDQVRIVPDDRTNSLVVLAGSREAEKIAGLIARLDKPSPRGTGNLKVYGLANADAEELAKVLSGFAESQQKAATGAAAPGGDSPAPAPVISQGTTIVADPSTNSLIVNANPEDFEVLDEILEKLDRPRQQVYVEALIMEVSSDTTISFGVNWNLAQEDEDIGEEGGLVFGTSNPAGFTPLITQDTFVPPAGFAAGLVSFPVTIAGVTFSNLQALIEASKTNNAFNIISTPQLMTLDNEEASIVVSENRPFLTSQDVGTSTTDRVNQKFEYRDVGTTLKVTPQITENDTIKLVIYQKTSRVDEAVTEVTGALQPTTRNRTTETTVLVRNSQTVVISGLIGESSSVSRGQLPWLGDIPVLGWLFKNERRSADKTNLLVFITPRVMHNPAEADQLFHEKIRAMEEVRLGPDDRVLPRPKEMLLFDPVLEEGDVQP